MSKKLAQSLQLMAVVAAMMLGGGMVEAGRGEAWVEANSSVPTASKQNSATGSTENNLQQIADFVTDQRLVETNDCPQAHCGF